MRFSSQFLIASLLVATTGCETPTLYSKQHDVLRDALSDIDTGDYATVQKDLETLVVETTGVEGDYSLQRFYAALLLVRSNLAASLYEPFLLEPKAMNASGERPSWIAQTVAAKYEVSNAEGWADRAERSATTLDGVELLPEALASYSIPTAREYFKLANIFTATRLDFHEDVARIIRNSPDLLEVSACEEAMNRTAIDERIRPWILFGIFDHLKQIDEVEAYRFGIQARLAADQVSKSAAMGNISRDVLQWIDTESTFVFMSSRGVAFHPELSGDPEAGQKNIDYAAQKKQ